MIISATINRQFQQVVLFSEHINCCPLYKIEFIKSDLFCKHSVHTNTYGQKNRDSEFSVILTEFHKKRAYKSATNIILISQKSTSFESFLIYNPLIKIIFFLFCSVEYFKFLFSICLHIFVNLLIRGIKTLAKSIPLSILIVEN